MIKVAVATSFLLIGFLAKAQEFQGKAEYYSKRFFKNEIGTKPDDEPELKKAYEDALKKASENRFILTFNKKEALFEKQESLEKPTPNNAKVTVTMTFSGQGKTYINTKDKVRITEDDILGKEFLIVDSLKVFKWKLTDETRKIGEYTCYKAETLIPVSEKEKKEYEEYLKKQNTTSFFTMEEPKEKKIVVWYTPEVPVSVGPSNYWGLPGLILEVNDGETVVLCSKLTLNNKETAKIKVPHVGKEVSQDEFDTIHKDILESMDH